MVKISSVLAVFTIGCLAALTSAQAVAQSSSSTPAVSAVQQSAPSAPQNEAPAGQPPQVAGGPPAAMPGGVADPSLMVDNGLWEGAETGPCCSICGGGASCPPDWYTEQGVRILGRSRPRTMVYGIDLQGTVFSTIVAAEVFNDLLTSRSANPDVSGAYAMTIGHYFARDVFNRDNFIEFSFWGLNNWQDQAQITGHLITDTTSEAPNVLQYGSLFSGFFNPFTGQMVNGFDRADTQTTAYASYTNNFEINGRIVPRGENDRLVLEPNGRWRRECQPGTYISYLYGLRFMQIDETFRFHSQGTTTTFDTSGGATPDFYTGDYDVVTHNNLLGIQVGADMTFRHCRWSWGITSKIGPYINFADQTSTVRAVDVTNADVLLSNDIAAAKHVASLIGEVGFEATYKFQPNLMGRAGWDLMWVTGLALAPEQVQFTTSPVDKVNTNGSMFLQGLSLSLEWMW